MARPCADNLFITSTSSSEASLMMIAQQFFQQQQQQQHFQLNHDSWPSPSSGAEVNPGWEPEFCIHPHDHDPFQDSSYFTSQTSATAPLTPELEQRIQDLEQCLVLPDDQSQLTVSKPSCDEILEQCFDSSTYKLSDHAISPPTPDRSLVNPEDTDWMECFMNELEQDTTHDGAAAAVVAAPESSSQSSELLGYPCTPEDIWREHSVMNLHSGSTDHRWAPSSAATELSSSVTSSFTSKQYQVQPMPSQHQNRHLGQQHSHYHQTLTTCQASERRDVHLIRLLLTCLEDIETGQTDTATKHLNKLRALSNVSGDPLQRVASYFADGLEARLGNETNSPTDLNCPEAAAVAYKTLNDACPYLKFAHLTANQVILDATSTAEKIHIVDYGTMQGVQWAALLQAFAVWPSETVARGRKIRITGIPNPELGPDPRSSMIATGKRLAEFAKLLDLDFEFLPLMDNLENLDATMLKIEEGEVVAVNFVLQLSQLSAQALRRAFAMVHQLNPKVVAVAEYEANNGTTLQTQLVNNARFYASIFESMDVAVARDDPERIKAEKFYFGKEIRRSLLTRNSTEGNDQWQRCIDNAGLWSAPMSYYTMSQARLLLWLYNSDNFTLTEGPGSLSLGWLGRSIVTVSAWHC